jgi:cation diffusion facilitator family transporter
MDDSTSIEGVQTRSGVTAEAVAVRKVTWLGLAMNIALVALKLLTGLLGRSQVLVADAVHSLSDTVTDVAVLVGVGFWLKPADENHPYGHRRIETFVTLAIGVMLALAGLQIGWTSLATLREAHGTPPNRLCLVVALVSVGGKEWIFRWTRRVARRWHSTALEANAWHHRSDAFSSIVAVLAVGGAILLPAWTFLDHVGAVIVSLFVVQAAWTILWPGLRELADSGAPQDSRTRILKIARETRGVCRVHGLRTRYVGSNLQVDLHVLVDGALTVRAGHDIAEEVKHRLVQHGPRVIDVVVHTEPCDIDRPAGRGEGGEGGVHGTGQH